MGTQWVLVHQMVRTGRGTCKAPWPLLCVSPLPSLSPSPRQPKGPWWGGRLGN